MALPKPPPNSPLRLDHPLAQGLVGAWPMWEGAGGYVYDATGRGNTGTLTNMDPATDWVPTPYGMGLDFDGTDDHLRLPTGSLFQSQSRSFGMLARVFFRTNGDGTGRAIMCAGTSGGWFLRRQNQGTIALLKAWVKGVAETKNVVSLNEWHTVGFTVGAAATADVVIYIDGRVSLATTSAVTFGSSSVASIGAEINTTTPFSLLDGVLTDVQVFGRILTPTDAAMYHADSWAIWRPRKRWWYTSAGATIHYISGSLAIGSAGSAGGVVVAPVAGSLPISAAGQAQGNVVAPIAGALPIGASGSAGGAVVAPVGGALNIGAAGAAAGSVVAPVGGALAIGAAGTADGVVVAPVAGSLPIGAGGAAAGNVVAPVAGSLGIGAAGQAEGVVVAPIAGELEIGAEGTAAGTVVTEGGARGWLAPVLESGRYES